MSGGTVAGNNASYIIKVPIGDNSLSRFRFIYVMYKESTILQVVILKLHSKATFSRTVGRVYQEISVTHLLERGEEVLNIV